MKKILIAVGLIALAAACGEKPEIVPVPAKPAEAPLAPAAPTPAAEETKPFVIPPAAKKQAKYFPEGSPSRAIQDLDDMLDSYVLDPQTAEQRQYNEDLKRTVIKGTFDIRELCRLALDKHWGERTPQEQDAFVDLMIRLLEKKAIFSKEQGQKKAKKSKNVYSVTYEGHKFTNPNELNALAMSLVHIPSESLKIELNYKLKKDGGSAGGGWKIYDVIVDGASLLDNYKYQFDKIIAKEGYPNLVHRMESKLKELQEKDQK
ncbi:MAG TPA: ABC transporter substrate-binding protein [bacterium]|nr:ABC transporter substrate-binding protein [bacterium]